MGDAELNASIGLSIGALAIVVFGAVIADKIWDDEAFPDLAAADPRVVLVEGRPSSPSSSSPPRQSNGSSNRSPAPDQQRAEGQAKAKEEELRRRWMPAAPTMT